MDLRALADRRPLALAGASFSLGVAALLVSVPPLTVATTTPTWSSTAPPSDDAAGSR